MDEKRHKLLESQLTNLSEIISDLPGPIRSALEHFIDEVNETYHCYEEARELLEHSMEVSSEELSGANKELQERNLVLQKMEEEAKALSIQFQAIFDNAGLGIVGVGDEQRMLYVNTAFEKMTGYSKEELLQKTIYDITCPEDLSESKNRYAKTREGGSFTQCKRYVKKDGTIFWARLTATIASAYDKRIKVVGVIEDITAQREGEETIRRQQIQIQSAAIAGAHSAGMSEIATGALHNVGNVLNSANVGTELIIRRWEHSAVGNLLMANDLMKKHKDHFADFYNNDPKAKKLLEYYLEVGDALKKEMEDQKHEAAELMERIQLIKDIINTQQIYAKGRSEFKERVSLAELVENALITQHGSLVRHEIKIVKKIAAVPAVLAQRTKLMQVLINLIKNAKEAMAVHKGSDRVLTLEVGREGDAVFLRVCDTGIGIEKENLQKIFNHGFTTKQTGHGFGLHFSANAATEMGGRISAASEGLGKGAQFTIVFTEQKEVSGDPSAPQKTARGAA